jgi:hypothetical protein
MIRLFCGAAVCAALLLSYTRWTFDWSEELAVGKDVAGERISLQVERDRETLLKEQFEELNERIAAKDQIADHLLAGEMTLPQAAAAFGNLYEQARTFGELCRVYPNCSTDEILGRQVIAWVEAKLRFEQSPEEAEAVRHRLEAELRKHLAGQGTAEQAQ